MLFALFVFINSTGTHERSIWSYGVFVISTLLYPYSRFVYESIIGFVLGNNVFFLNAVIMMIAKLITMLLCWLLAIFIAPIGLAYLYFYHSKAQR